MCSRKLISILCIAIVLIAVQVATAQTKKRLIPFPDWSLDNTDDEVSLELVEIKIAGKPIALDKPFDADDNWLKNMTLRIKNVGTKPLVAFDVGGGLLHRVGEELPMHASFQFGIAWNWGKHFNLDNEKHHGPVLNAGDTVELTYANVSSLTRRVLAKEGEGAFCKLKFMAPAIQYADGSSPSIPPMRFRKTLYQSLAADGAIAFSKPALTRVDLRIRRTNACSQRLDSMLLRIMPRDIA